MSIKITQTESCFNESLTEMPYYDNMIGAEQWKREYLIGEKCLKWAVVSMSPTDYIRRVSLAKNKSVYQLRESRGG